MDPKKEAVKLAIKKLFTDSSFSICAVDKIAKLTNSIPDKDTYEIMSTVHCVSYSEMKPEFRKWLFSSVLSMCSGNGFEITETDFVVVEEPQKPFSPENKSWIHKLLTR